MKLPAQPLSYDRNFEQQRSGIIEREVALKVPEAPVDGSQYARKNGAWEAVSAVGATGPAGTDGAGFFGPYVQCVQYSSTAPTPVNGLLATRTASTISIQTPAAGGSNLVAYIARVRDQSGASANSATQLRFVTDGSGLLNSATKAEAGGGRAYLQFSPYALNSDSRVFWGLCADAGSGVLAGATNPSSRTNIIGFGCDSGDSNWQWIHNDGSGTATKSDIGISKASLVGTLLTLDIVLAGDGTASMTLTNQDSGATYTKAVTSDAPAIDTFLYMCGFTGTGPTTVSVGHEICYFAILHPA